MKKKPPFPPKPKKADEPPKPKKKGRGMAPRGGGFMSGLMKM